MTASSPLMEGMIDTRKSIDRPWYLVLKRPSWGTRFSAMSMEAKVLSSNGWRRPRQTVCGGSFPVAKVLDPIDELAGEADPPVVEQLVTPNAMRQRRFRERKQALGNADVTPKAALPNATDNAVGDEAT